MTVLSLISFPQGALAEAVDQTSTLIEAYIEVSALPPPPDVRSRSCSSMPFPSSIRRRVANLHLVPVVSRRMRPPRMVGEVFDGDPDGAPTFGSFGGEIQFVGGINAPKLIRVTGSDGKEVKELVKSGNDDLRQDAVMQQVGIAPHPLLIRASAPLAPLITAHTSLALCAIRDDWICGPTSWSQMFSLINALLSSDAECRRRGLRIRTYRVVPFTPACGLVGWVDNTMPLLDWLVGKDYSSGAHARYAPPGGMTHFQCHKRIKDSQPDRHALAAAWAEVVRKFPPVLHHFFLESFRDPRAWFERRLTYTRSVAASSMAGHLLGLGDRHSANILLDLRTAEVVHIDLGIAFEQGRLLNTPELVPFRMTRDIVDGMGHQGVEGPLRRCMEASARVLRANRDALLTVVEVFIHDPLFKWALTPARAKRRQRGGRRGGAAEGGESEEEQDGLGALSGAEGQVLEGSADATWTILRIKQKLEGTGEENASRRSKACCCGSGCDDWVLRCVFWAVLCRVWRRGGSWGGRPGAAAPGRREGRRPADEDVRWVGAVVLTPTERGEPRCHCNRPCLSAELRHGLITVLGDLACSAHAQRPAWRTLVLGGVIAARLFPWISPF